MVYSGRVRVEEALTIAGGEHCLAALPAQRQNCLYSNTLVSRLVLVDGTNMSVQS